MYRERTQITFRFMSIKTDIVKQLVIALCLAISVLLASTSFAHEKNTVYIYHDEGVSEESLTQTIATFETLLTKYAIKTINAEQVKSRVWTQDAALFVMPGGADLPYTKKLNGKGNDIIKRYVKDGGAFLGICAGSYYASSYVEFDKNGPLEVLGNRELSFFKGRAVGPILAPYDYKTQSGARAAKIRTILTDVTVFYNCGGFFENAESYPNTKVIATYENNLPAIIFV